MKARGSLSASTASSRLPAYTTHVSDLDPCKGRGSSVEGLEAHHGSSDPLDEPVICYLALVCLQTTRRLFKNIVEIFDLPDRDYLARPSEIQDHIHGHQASLVCATLVDDHPI